MEKTMIIGIIILTFIIWSWAIIDLLKSEFKNKSYMVNYNSLFPNNRFNYLFSIEKRVN